MTLDMIERISLPRDYMAGENVEGLFLLLPIDAGLYKVTPEEFFRYLNRVQEDGTVYLQTLLFIGVFIW